MAEATTRHTSEVDTYDLGRFAGLSSRHNVRHWGGGAEEARIRRLSVASVTTSPATECTGNLMRAVVEVDYKVTEIDPMRLASPRTRPIPYPGPYARRPRLARLRRQLDDRIGNAGARLVSRQDHRRHGFDHQNALRLHDRT
jgi:YetA-like protein